MNDFLMDVGPYIVLGAIPAAFALIVVCACVAGGRADRLLEAGSPSASGGQAPPVSPLADLSKPHGGDREGAQRVGPGRTRTAVRPVLDDRPLLRLIDEHRAADELYPRRRDVQAVRRYQPSRHPDGSTSDWTRSFDVISDALAAPGDDTPGAA